MLRRTVCAALVAACCATCLTACGKARAANQDPRLPAVVLSGPGAAKWLRLLRASGVAARLGTLDEIDARAAAIVPSEITLDAGQRQRLVAWVDRGGRLLTPNAQLLLDLGFRYGKAHDVDTATMDGVGQAISWPRLPLLGLDAGPALRDVHRIAAAGGRGVVLDAAHDRGRVLALAVNPVGDPLVGHELLPALGSLAARWLGTPPAPSRTGLELYLDPGGLRDGSRPLTPAEIVGRVTGARAVHIAAWNTGYRDPAQDYPYDQLIAVLHAHGILAYAWLEPPFVNLRLWEDHPECREKTAAGHDAVVDWRHLIALKIPACFTLAWQVWRDVLTTHPWDGVNIAELYFEPGLHPGEQTPYHPSALARFGRNPASDPAGFLRFRTDLAVELNQAMLAQANGLPGKAGLDFELTVIDDRLDPDLGRRVGSDVRRLARVAATGGASLQIEDPFTTWRRGPLRYDSLQDELTSLMPPGRALLDVNVVDRVGAQPTEKMTGVELALAAASAAQRTGRLGVYSAGTVLPEDEPALPLAMAGAVEITDSGLRSPWTVVVPAPWKGANRLRVDGRPWPVGAGVAVVPGGEHQLVWSGGSASDQSDQPSGQTSPALVRCTCEVGDESSSPGHLTLRYDSRPVVYAVLDAAPDAVTVDGKPAALAAVADPDGGTSVRLPAGHHRVTLTF